MTDAWAALAMAMAAQGQEPPVTVEPIDGVLTVEWRHKQIRPGDGAVVFSGGVVARYGSTTLKADKLTLYQAETRKEGRAEGNVHIEDPDADALADSLIFSWLNQTAKGTNVSVQVDGLYVKAESVDITPELWTLRNATAAPDGSKRPLFAMKSPTLEYRPNKGGVARKASISILGAKIVTLPSYKFGQKKGEFGLRMPSIAYNQGLALSWNSTFRIDDRTRVGAGGRVKQNDKPGGAFELTRSLLPRNEPNAFRQPESDIGERFSFGYFDTVLVKRPAIEREELSARRSSITFGATANASPVARLSQELVTKPFDIVLEQGGLFSGFGLSSGVRYQSLQQDGGANERRLILGGALLAPALPLGGGLATHLRFDGSTYLGKNSFRWGQAQAGLTFNPSPQVRMGAAFVYGSHAGEPTFDIDRLFSTRAFHGRFDLDLGTTRLSLLTKYDMDRRKWYDNEIGLSQMLGPIEPFITFREFPRTVTFGVRLRAEQAFDRLRQRLEKRTPNRVKEDKP